VNPVIAIAGMLAPFMEVLGSRSQRGTLNQIAGNLSPARMRRLGLEKLFSCQTRVSFQATGGWTFFGVKGSVTCIGNLHTLPLKSFPFPPPPPSLGVSPVTACA